PPARSRKARPARDARRDPGEFHDGDDRGVPLVAAAGNGKGTECRERLRGLRWFPRSRTGGWMSYYDQVKQAADAIRARVSEIPQIAIVLGSCLGDFTRSLGSAVTMSYGDL